MLDYIIRRLMIGVLVLITLSILLFIIMHSMPGDPIQLIAGDRADPQKILELRIKFGLDKPIYIQYFKWLFNALRGDFGISILASQPVSDLIMSRFKYTLMLSGIAVLLQYILAIPIALLAAVKKNSFFDKVTVYTTIIFWSTPQFWLGILLILLFAIKFPIFPISGFEGPISLVLPVATILLTQIASGIRITRSEIVDILNEKYVVTAYAKGLRKKTILIRHVLRNALIPTTVMFFLSIPWIIGGSVIVEKIFAYPGMGYLLWTSITKQDYPVVQGIVMIITLLTVISNTLGDVIIAYLDPRIRKDMEGV
ncbi:ABC transporter permease [Clostridium sp.]|uniref:ABC transporter permease n=1 Tax=Clostridium sp. TaxID=1506 RepID=UPI001A5CBA09|nr:ABC transporter permease [Clostridium sp.]MBK5242589.1 ABC transporter permease [Clostridium sp.]